MEVLVINSDSCKGCRFCIVSCPKGALSVSDVINSKGYLPVKVDSDKCICCGVCFNVCPDCVFEIKEGGNVNG